MFQYTGTTLCEILYRRWYWFMLPVTLLCSSQQEHGTGYGPYTDPDGKITTVSQYITPYGLWGAVLQLV